MRWHDCKDQFGDRLHEIMYTPNVFRIKLTVFCTICKRCSGVSLFMLKRENTLSSNHLSGVKKTATRNCITNMKLTMESSHQIHYVKSGFPQMSPEINWWCFAEFTSVVLVHVNAYWNEKTRWTSIICQMTTRLWLETALPIWKSPSRPILMSVTWNYVFTECFPK